LIATAFDEILGACVKLELRDDALDDVGFVVVDLRVEMKSVNCTVLELNLEFLVADFGVLPLELRAWKLLIPAVRHLTIDWSLLSFSQLHDDGVTVTWSNGEAGLHENTSVLVLKIGKGGKSAGSDFVDVLLVLIPCSVPATS
jgi:hypothetical protein